MLSAQGLCCHQGYKNIAESEAKISSWYKKRGYYGCIRERRRTSLVGATALEGHDPKPTHFQRLRNFVKAGLNIFGANWKYEKGNIKLHTFNTYLQGGAAYGAINTFENLISTYPEIDGTFFYMQDLSNGQKLQKLTKEKYAQRHPLSLNTSIAKRLLHSIKARKHYKNIQKSLKQRPKDYEQFSTPHQYYSTPYNWFAKQPRYHSFKLDCSG